jgi:pheromone shutdown protein TraB
MVRERLNLAELSPEEQGEIVAELAGHLADLCHKYCVQGLSESEAVTRAIHEVSDWRGLAKTIQRAKLEEETMNHRTKRLWVPGLVSTAIALVLPILLLMTLTRFGVEPGRKYATTIGALWLLASAFGGAIGAFLSRRAGGKPFARLASALFPVVVFVVAIGFVCGFIVLARSFGAYQLAPWRELARVLPTISVYGAVLLLGALPFLRPRRGGESGVSHA